MRPLLQSLERALLPPVCLLCGDGGYGPDICRGCRGDLPSNLSACRRCALPAPRAVAGVCDSCLATPPAWASGFCAYRYEFPVDVLVKRLKYDGRLVYGRLLGQLLALELRRRRLAPGGARPDCVMAVPLHPARERERGFNQAGEIGLYAARLLGLTLSSGTCRRRRDTPAQAQLEAAERQRNVAGAFDVAGDVRGMHVAVIDDVMTTGATAGAVARALRRAGARRVDVWAVARSLGPSRTHERT